jgi:hypothetical protein
MPGLEVEGRIRRGLNDRREQGLPENLTFTDNLDIFAIIFSF